MLEFHHINHLILKEGDTITVAIYCSFSGVISSLLLLLQCLVICGVWNKINQTESNDQLISNDHKNKVIEKRINQRANQHHIFSKDHKGEDSHISSRNSSPSFGFAMARYFENWPLYDWILVFAPTLIVAVTLESLLLPSGVSSTYFLVASSNASMISCYKEVDVCYVRHWR